MKNGLIYLSTSASPDIILYLSPSFVEETCLAQNTIFSSEQEAHRITHHQHFHTFLFFFFQERPYQPPPKNKEEKSQLCKDSTDQRTSTCRKWIKLKVCCQYYMYIIEWKFLLVINNRIKTHPPVLAIVSDWLIAALLRDPATQL